MLPRNITAGLSEIVGVAAVALLAAPGVARGQAAGDSLRGRPRPAGEAVEKVYYDVPDEHGQLSGGFVTMLMTAPGGVAGSFDAPVTTILDNGPSANRIDLVFVGDGYLDTQFGLYAIHVGNGFSELFGVEPFSTYMTFFNAHRVDVSSNESGVDNDPTPGIDRDTTLNMGFWCDNIERLLCVDVGLAYQYAANAPQVDHVFAVANSTKYGGAGYSGSDLATYSGGNGAAAEVAIHEAGHSLGNLADEYDYNDGATYTGPERPERNISVHGGHEVGGLAGRPGPRLRRPCEHLRGRLLPRVRDQSPDGQFQDAKPRRALQPAVGRGPHPRVLQDRGPPRRRDADGADAGGNRDRFRRSRGSGRSRPGRGMVPRRQPDPRRHRDDARSRRAGPGLRRL
jgi:hypothetical protein